MKKIITLACLLLGGLTYAQDSGYLSGSFESNTKWYNDDPKTGPFENANDPLDDEELRSNNYLKFDYTYKHWGAGIQLESYYPKPLLSYSPKYEDTGLSTFYAEYRSRKLKVTAGYFYEQFGSGLILRTWEDRQLGINNALLGGRITYRPSNNVLFTALYGRQKEGFDLSEGQIFGFNTEFDLDDWFGFEETSLGIGFSYVGRYEEADPAMYKQIEPFDDLTNAFSFRLDFSQNSFYFNGEYVSKSPDINVIRGSFQEYVVEPGSALLVNMGYVNQGLGINATFRRLENMAFFSDREAAGNDFNANIVNYVPALTKQHDYLLTNIYVYQAQPMVNVIQDKAGEIGGQVDVYYNFKQGSALGGKYGTKIALNASYWAGLKGTYESLDQSYEVDYLGFGDKYFSDVSVELRKRFSPNFNTILTYVNQFYSKKYLRGELGAVKTDIAVAEINYSFNNKQSMRFVAQHMWADHDLKNWAGGTLEFNVNPQLSFYVSDTYNYGNDKSADQTHYYNVGGSYTVGPHRFALNYGRQRGGIICVGGVCRYVPPSTGLSASISILF